MLSDNESVNKNIIIFKITALKKINEVYVNNT